jgi:hypothetical protein
MTRVSSVREQWVVVESRGPAAAAAARGSALADLDVFATRLRAARLRLQELAGMLEGPPGDTEIVDGVQRAARRLCDGVLAQARRTAEALVDDAAASSGSVTVLDAGDAVVGVDRDDRAIRRHREVVELQRGVEELSFVVIPLVAEHSAAQVASSTVRMPPDEWTSADAFAEVFR